MPDGAAMISIESALSIVDAAAAKCALSSETVATLESRGRHLAEECVSLIDIPPFDKSSMDGFAVLEGDVREEYEVVETVPAGKTAKSRLVEGSCVKVMTGAEVPYGTGQVIKIESVEDLGGKIHVPSREDAKNICKRGEDVRKGDVVISSGARLGSLEIANLLSCGVSSVVVKRRVRVAIISTGDELVDDFSKIGPGKIIDSNGPLLEGLCRDAGFEVVQRVAVADEQESIQDALQGALSRADFVILSGGVSVGEFDFVAGALERAKLQVAFSRVAIKPAKPMTFASGNGQLVFALPGNPVAVFLTFHLFIRRAGYLLLAGQAPRMTTTLTLADDFKRKKVERTEFVPCKLGSDGLLERVSCHGTADLRAMMAADGFFIVPVGIREVAAGERVEYFSVASQCQK